MKLNHIYQGDVIDRLKDLNDGSVQCVVTSPPYWGLRDYGTAEWEGGDKNCDHKMPPTGGPGLYRSGHSRDGYYSQVCKKCNALRKDDQLGLESTPEEFVENLVKVFREVRRVLKDDGTVWLNLGDSYAMSSMRGKNSEFKSIDQSKQGIVGINKKIPIGLKPKDLVGIPWRVAFALQADGWYLRQDIIWHKPNPMPESVTDRCTKAHEYIFLLSKSAKYFYDADAIAEKSLEYGKDKRSDLGNIRYEGKRTLSGSNKNKLHKNLKNKGQPNHSMHTARANGQQSFVTINKTRNKRSVWKINTKPYKEAHFATFPEELPTLCIKAGSKKEDVVLDPFFGSGTTGWVAQRLSRAWIGIELNPEYIKIAEKRFIQQDLFV